MKRALITGIAGFAGSHLADHLLSEGWEVSGIDRRTAVAAGAAVEKCDILDPGEVGRAVEKARPDVVFHMAAVAFVPSAENAPQSAFSVNAAGTLNVLDECRRHAPGARVVIASSAEVYGKVTPDETPLTEAQEPRPANIYALTKLCAEDVAYYYARAYSLPAVILRPFNHIGPRQSPDFVTSSFARQIALIEAGLQPPVISVGNLEAARDFTDVRDTVRGYTLAAENCEPGKPYNICSGQAYVISDILDRLLKMSRVSIEIRVDPARLRKSEIPIMLGDYTLFTRATGWSPEHDIDSTLSSILNYWRSESGSCPPRPLHKGERSKSGHCK